MIQPNEYLCEGCGGYYLLEELPSDYAIHGKCFGCKGDDEDFQDAISEDGQITCIHCGAELVDTICPACGVVNEKTVGEIMNKK
jgi:hypothetical protein